MILYEYEGKKILSDNNISVPQAQLIQQGDQINLKPPYFLKAQVLSGKRMVTGGIIQVENQESSERAIEKLFKDKINNEDVTRILVEKSVEYSKEYYLSLSYDTTNRCPLITFSESGGTGIEDRSSIIEKINILDSSFDNSKFPKEVCEVIEKLIKIFLENDCLLLEINPLVVDSNKNLVALDAKVKLDDTAASRHKDWAFEPRSVAGHKPTKREIEAKKIDQEDYRGTAGSTYFDLPGDIAVLASGGGASLTAMDSLIAAGGKPSNYTEYSGNPPKEKVEKLTEIVLSKEDLNGLWVVGAIANFTDIFETLSGFIEALKKIKPKPGYPILIRRGGPRDKEAFEMLKKIKDFDLHIYGEEITITESAKIMADLSKKYAITKRS